MGLRREPEPGAALREGLHGRLRARRLELGWSLRKVEAETGISSSHVSQVERGVIRDPSWRIVTALEQAYRLTPYRGQPAPELPVAVSWASCLHDWGRWYPVTFPSGGEREKRDCRRCPATQFRQR